jgi:hypothetical protein
MPEQAFEIDGMSMRTEAYNVSTQTGRWEMPGPRGDDLTLPGRSGYVFAPNKPLDAGVGSLAVWCIAKVPSTGAIPATQTLRQSQFSANMALLQRVFTRRHRLVTLRAQQADASWRTAAVQFTEWASPIVSAGGTRAEWSIGYTIPDVFWKDETDTTQQTATGATLPKTLDLTSFTNMTGIIEDAVITVTGPITNPRVTDTETGAWIQYTGTLASSAVWTIDCKAFTSSVAPTVGSVLAATSHAGSYRFLIIPNLNGVNAYPQLVLSGSGGGTNTKFGVIARRKWVTA